MRKFALFNREKQAHFNLFVATPIEKMHITGQQATQSHISSTPLEQNLVVEEKEYYSYTSSIDTNHTDCFLLEETDSEIPVVQLEIEKMGQPTFL